VQQARAKGDVKCPSHGDTGLKGKVRANSSWPKRVDGTCVFPMSCDDENGLAHVVAIVRALGGLSI